jgi:two-component system response regulator ResD
MSQVLLVEDDQFLRDLYTETLSSEQIQLTSAASGQEALTLIPNKSWDLILLDVFLPGMTGIDIMKSLIQQFPDKLFPVVFLTNTDDPQTLEQIASFGYTYLIKSEMTPDVLSQRVSQLVEDMQKP